MKWSCDIVDAELCKELTAEYGRTSGDERAAVLIERAWTAHLQSKKERRQ